MRDRIGMRSSFNLVQSSFICIVYSRAPRCLRADHGGNSVYQPAVLEIQETFEYSPEMTAGTGGNDHQVGNIKIGLLADLKCQCSIALYTKRLIRIYEINPLLLSDPKTLIIQSGIVTRNFDQNRIVDGNGVQFFFIDMGIDQNNRL